MRHLALILGMAASTTFAGWEPPKGYEHLAFWKNCSSNLQRMTEDPNTRLYPETGVFGLAPEQREYLLGVLRKHFGEDLVAVYASSSRASGLQRGMKNAFINPNSDLDLQIQVKHRSGGGPGTYPYRDAAKELQESGLFDYPVDLHGASTPNNQPFAKTLPAFQHGYNAEYQIVPHTVPASKRPANTAIRLDNFGKTP